MKKLLIVLLALAAVTGGAWAQNKAALTIICNQSGAQVFVAGRLVGTTTPNFSMLLPINTTYDVKVTKTGFKDFSTKVNLTSAGATINVNLEAVGTTTTTTTTTTPSGRFNVTYTSSVPNTEVWVDGKKIGKTPIVVFTDAGTHQVRFTAPGYTDDNQTINVTGVMTVSANLAATVVNYNLTVTANVAGADVYIQGALAGKAPLTKAVPSGSYSVRVTAPGYNDFNQNVVVNGNITVNAVLAPNLVNLTVNANVAGAEVFLNGTKYGVAPITIPLAPGSYNLVVQAPGYNAFSQSVNLTGAQTVNATLTPVAYTLTVSANVAGADVFINNSPVGKAPYSTSLPAGSYNIRVSAPGYMDYNQSVVMNGNQAISAVLQPQMGTVVVSIDGLEKLKELQVYIDGVKVNKFPYALAPGKHEIRITIGPLVYVGTFIVEPGKTVIIEPFIQIQIK